MQIFLATRQSPDWRQLADDFAAGKIINPSRFRPPEHVPGFPANIVDLIGKWNSCFGVDFFRCRAQIKAIADNHLSRIAGISRIRYEEADRVLDRGGDFVLFYHDDDDWFAPDLANVIAPLTHRAFDVCVFPLVRLWTDTLTFVRSGQDARVIVGRRSDFSCRYQSNNYGLRGRICDSSTIRAMKDHVEASEYADDRSFVDFYSDSIVGVTAKTPCSASMLQEIFSAAGCERRELRNYIDALGAVHVPPEVEWMSEGITELAEVFTQALARIPLVGISTVHGTMVYVDDDTGELRHGLAAPPLSRAPCGGFAMPPSPGGQLLCWIKGDRPSPVSVSAASGCQGMGACGTGVPNVFALTHHGRGLIGLQSQGLFLCAEPDGSITLSRSQCSDWEQFQLAPSGFVEASAIANLRGVIDV